MVGLVAVIMGILYAKQDGMLYFPEIGGMPRRPGSNPRRFRSPEEHRIPFETHRIPCSDGVSVHSWLLLQKDHNAPTIIFFHGNAGNIGYRLPNAIQMYQDINAHVLMVEYRGFGDSDDAKPNEEGFKLDAEAALEFIVKHPRIDADKIFIFGRSIGGAVGFHLAKYAETKNLPLAGIMVENTFVSIPRMVDHLMPLVAPFKSLVLRIAWDNGYIVPRLRKPVLYLAGDADQLVPHGHMLELYKASRTSSICPRIHIVKGGTHNDTWYKGGKAYWDAIKKFMQEVMAAEGDEQRQGGSQHQQQQRSSSVAMGVATDESIPIMPGNLFGIAKEVTASGASSSMFSSQHHQQQPQNNKQD